MLRQTPGILSPKMLLAPVLFGLACVCQAQDTTQRSDQCARSVPEFGFNSAARPLAHAFECWQTDFKPSHGVKFPDGWYLQYIRGLHTTANCPAGSTGCDLEITRMCHKSRTAGLMPPCHAVPGSTGPLGCAVCQATLSPHSP
jgi:hypothetical protein